MGNNKGPWISQQKSDKYYRKSKVDHHRARSYYKLEQIDQKYHVLTSRGRFPKSILDLGAAPGAWLEYIKNQYEKQLQNLKPSKPSYVGIDLRTIRPFEEAPFITSYRYDIFKPECHQFIAENGPWDVILSDLAPKTAGDFRDIAIQEEMVSQVFTFLKYLKNEGNIVVKIFQSEQTDPFVKEWSEKFRLLKRIKPEASRSKSRELYIVGLGYFR
ncbi:MAG: RlmE family RNA methyltransferase [Promethearchaeota archaeon]|nr:MAG: RlmE family RNA methyltransferase [Candidatus Lokiarchaeota archaeon]